MQSLKCFFSSNDGYFANAMLNTWSLQIAKGMEYLSAKKVSDKFFIKAKNENFPIVSVLYEAHVNFLDHPF